MNSGPLWELRLCRHLWRMPGRAYYYSDGDYMAEEPWCPTALGRRPWLVNDPEAQLVGISRRTSLSRRAPTGAWLRPSE